MKKIISMFAFMASFGMTSAQDDCIPAQAICNAVLHGKLQIDCYRSRNFCATLSGSEPLIAAFCKDVARSAKANFRQLQYASRGNMVEFKYQADSFHITYHLWLRNEDNEEGDNAVTYELGHWHSGTDLWMHPKFPGPLTAYDSDSDFSFHALIVAEMMKSDLVVPEKLAERLAYNFADKSRLDAFLCILATEGLQVRASTKQDEISVANGHRSYYLIKACKPERDFPVSLAWEEN